MRRIFCFLLVLALAACGCSLAEFATVDMEGNEVNESIFDHHKVTIVNLWATWCTWCIYEMPEFHDLVENLPDDIGFITVCDDAQDAYDDAQALLAENNANWTTLVMNDEVMSDLFPDLSAYPTTIFVDSEGRRIGEPVIGVPDTDGHAAEIYLQLAQEALAEAD